MPLIMPAFEPTFSVSLATWQRFQLLDGNKSGGAKWRGPQIHC